MRYLSTPKNHIFGEENSPNDQFMRVNAFLGNADLSMILHMLSQRSDTDLLSAPKVLTGPGKEATMKVVVEYIYPTEYDVQLTASGGGSSEILAVVEPENFTMREVGVILQVTPELSQGGQLINLHLHPQVVSDPSWKNYGMRIPKSSNSQFNAFDSVSSIMNSLVANLTTLGGLTAEETQKYRDLLGSSAADSIAAIKVQVNEAGGGLELLGGSKGRALDTKTILANARHLDKMTSRWLISKDELEREDLSHQCESLIKDTQVLINAGNPQSSEDQNAVKIFRQAEKYFKNSCK